MASFSEWDSNITLLDEYNDLPNSEEELGRLGRIWEETYGQWILWARRTIGSSVLDEEQTAALKICKDTLVVPAGAIGTDGTRLFLESMYNRR